MAEYDVGDARRLEVVFKNISSVVTDPTTVTFKIKEPDDTITTYVYGTDAEVLKASTGTYYVDFTITQEGVHHWGFFGTGALVQAEESSFRVRRQGTSSS